MKKLFLVVLMMLACSAWAEWVMYFEAKTITYFYDPATIRKDGNMRRVWRVQELKQRTADGEKSRRMRIEYDCKEGTDRLLSLTWYAKNMRQGDVVLTSGYPHEESAPIPPGTTAEILFKLACGK